MIALRSVNPSLRKSFIHKWQTTSVDVFSLRKLALWLDNVTSLVCPPSCHLLYLFECINTFCACAMKRTHTKECIKGTHEMRHKKSEYKECIKITHKKRT